MMKAKILALALAVSISSLAGCTATPPKPAMQMTDAELCTTYGYSMAMGDSNRMLEVGNEAQKRMDAHGGVLSVPKETCQALSQAGVNQLAQEQAETARSQAAWAAIGQMGQQMQAQQAQQNAYNNQQMQQQQQMMLLQQQTQALQGINRSLGGW
ncbi:hypothetical protein [Citrobacter portucalensis]|uniref:hypothetical protein n=1 Tax=Citrobacter portucalensis TaxID=1639133 RepID=UPI003BF607A1